MIKKISTLLFPVVIIILLLLTGCVHTEKNNLNAVIATTKAFGFFTGEYENTPYFLKVKPSSIAVLPFSYSAAKVDTIDVEPESPANIVRSGMYKHISSLPFRDIEMYDTDRYLKNAGFQKISEVKNMLAKNPEKLKSILGVDAVVTGDVTHFDRVFLGIYSQIAVGCVVKMWDLETGNLLWRAENVARSHAGGISTNPIGLAMSAIASIWNLRDTELLNRTDELFREMVSSIDVPKSLLAAQPQAPRMDLFAAVDTDQVFTLGKKVTFRMIGDPGCKAYVDLIGFKSGITLTPVPEDVRQSLKKEVMDALKKSHEESGHPFTPELMKGVEQELAMREIYEGDYIVEPGEQQYKLIAKGYLVNTGGIQRTLIDAVNLVNIDSVPPQPPQGIVAEPLDNKIKVSWYPNNETDLTGYEIWTSDSPLSGYTLNMKTEMSDAVIGDLQNFKKIFVNVRAVDKAGNISEFGKFAETTPLPEPDLYALPQPGPALEGAIHERVLLVSEKNPYTVLSDVRVETGGALFIEPGVKIKFAQGSGLYISGGDLLAYGIENRPVSFVPHESGSWTGIVLENAKRVMMTHVFVEHADTGLEITNSKPSVISSMVTGCTQAGIYLRENAGPIITCSVISDNDGQGGLVIEGGGLTPIIQQNRFENNEPFHVQSYTPLEIDLSKNYWGPDGANPEKFLGNVILEPVLMQMPKCQ